MPLSIHLWEVIGGRLLLGFNTLHWGEDMVGMELLQPGSLQQCLYCYPNGITIDIRTGNFRATIINLGISKK